MIGTLHGSISAILALEGAGQVGPTVVPEGPVSGSQLCYNLHHAGFFGQASG